ncbi:MAG TPA: polysaccharide biosynthesis C-terminal domain-containing protein [Ktedonobacterales bacterium]|nr:polysaccharide biosynthesis C-terminal domain-containing protein [Ktedonobacterales bacterium]
MNVVRRTFSNIMMLMSGQIVTWISTLILAAAYGRFLGATGFGELYLATTFTALVGFPIEFSFNQQIVRDVARDLDAAHRYITMGLALKAALWSALFAFSLVLAALLGYSTEVRWLIALSGFSLLTMGISTTLISVQTAYMDVGMAKFGAVIEKVFDTIFALILLRAGYGVIPVGIVLVLGSIAGMIWQIVRTAKIIGIRFEWAPPIARTLIRSGMSFLAYGVIGVIYYRVDTVLLSVFATDASIGVYGAAYRLFDTLTFIPGIVVGAVMSPILSKYAVDTDRGKLRLAIEKSTSAMLLCSLPAAAGLLVTAPNIIGFIYQREDFTGSEYVLQALAIGLIALYLNSVLTTVLVSTGQERKLPIMASVALVFNVGLNLILIPRFMDMGAAWATTLTELLLLGIGLWMIDRALIPVKLLKTTAKILGATIIMAVVAHALDHFNILIIMPIAAAVYVAALLALRALPDEDIAMVKGMAARFIPRRALAVDQGAVAAELTLAGAPDSTMAGAPVMEIAAAEALSQFSGELAAVVAQADGAASAPAYTPSPEFVRLAARGEHSSTGSVPLNIPVRVARGFMAPRQRAGGATPPLQRRVQRRMAQLDARQVVVALAQGQLGRFALRMQPIEWRWPSGASRARITAAPASGRGVAPVRIQPLGAGASAPSSPSSPLSPSAASAATALAAMRLTPTYCVAIERQRASRRGKVSRGRHGHPARPRRSADAAARGRSSRPVVARAS